MVTGYTSNHTSRCCKGMEVALPHQSLHSNLQSMKAVTGFTGFNATAKNTNGAGGGMRICCSTAERDHC